MGDILHFSTLAAEANERFAAESKAIDDAYTHGRLDEWVAQQLERLRAEYDADSERPSGGA